MVAPALVAGAVKYAPVVANAVKGLGGKVGGLLSNGMNTVKSFGSGFLRGGGLDALAGKASDMATRAAYTKYLTGIADNMGNELEARADKYDIKLQNLYNTNEDKFNTEANTQLAELGQLVDDISQQGAEAQRQNRRQVQAELAQQGVRGGQAAILANRATGELNRDLQRDINQTVYNEAANRQNARLQNYSNQTIIPLQSMSGAYGTSLSGANNALSQAQGNVYSNAYDQAMKMFTGQDNASVAKAGAARTFTKNNYFK